MRIARPILLVSTPIGVLFGLREAWRLAGPGMALLMAAMLAVVGGLVWMTVRTIRREQRMSLDAADSRATTGQLAAAAEAKRPSDAA
jgi:uncharacterized membrane protein